MTMLRTTIIEKSKIMILIVVLTLSPCKSDQHPISFHNITLQLNIEVRKRKEIITKRRSP